jgi:peptide/nickel transport system permease protein
MILFFIQRLLSAIPVVVIVAIIIFSLLYVAPGDPAVFLAGEHASLEDVQRIRVALGLDQSFFIRFGIWAMRALKGDLGVSLFTNVPVAVMIGQRIEATLSLMVITLVISITIAIPIGVAAASRQGSLIDRATMMSSVLGFSLPVFVIGYVLAYFLALKAGWLPVQGYTPIAKGLLPWFRNLLLPALALSGGYIALIARITRATMIEVLRQDYIRTAKAKGASPYAILFVHALKNAALPIITIIGIGLTSLIGGAVVAESVFSIPGIGTLILDAILRRDYPVIQGVVLVLSIAYVIINMIIDLTYVLFDPRVSY